MSKHLPKPTGKAWSTAKLFKADIYNPRLPVCGCRLIWAVVGYKWVRCCTPITNIKWRMKRAEWDVMPTLEKGA